MHFFKKNRFRLLRLPDAFLPAAFFCAAILGRGDPALQVFIALILSRLCALSTASGLRSAFARQPSLRYVQGSAILALLLQLPGAAIALLILRAVRPSAFGLYAVGCGLALNIEHVFYEYLYAAGDGQSAALCESITALFTLAGLLLSAPSDRTAAFPSPDGLYPMLATSVSALVGGVIGRFTVGRPRPRRNGEVLRRAPLSMLQTALYPALALLLPILFKASPATSMPLFLGWIVHSLCQTPFRRSPLESRPLNRALLICCAAAALIAVPFMAGWLAPADPLLADIPFACAAVLLACACGFGLYGNVGRRDADL